TEASTFFEPDGNDAAAGQFFNAVMSLADRDDLAEVRDELRDQARMGLARKLRQNASSARRADLVSQLLGQPGTWPAAVVGDAHFAMKVTERTAPAPVASTPVYLGGGTVTAVVSAHLTGDVLIGFSDGTVVCFQPLSSAVVRTFSSTRDPVSSLA